MISTAASSLNLPLLAPRELPDRPSAALAALTGALARGDDAAWSEFHRDHGPTIFRQLLAATRGDHDLASEALQQTYLRVARHVRRCELEPVFAGWLRIVARTALSDCRRRRQSFWRLLERRRAEPVPPEVAGDEEHRLEAALAAALAALEPADRALLQAKYLAGSEVRTIAAELAISPKAAESRLTRARAALRTKLLALLAQHD